MAVPLPPPELRYPAQRFEETGRRFLELFIDLGGLQPTDDVLDLGCGIGRMAIPLTEYLTGRYEGIDVVPRAIAWCRDNITPICPSFTFQVADIRNTQY